MVVCPPLFSFLKVTCLTRVSGPGNPIAQEKEVVAGQSPSCCSALPYPAPRTQLWGTADFGGDTGVRETGAKSGKHWFNLFYIFCFFP